MNHSAKLNNIGGQIMDLLDTGILGPLNLIDRVFWLLGTIRHRGLGHRFKVTRMDKYQGVARGMAFPEITQLLKDRGVHTYGYTHCAHYIYFSVSKRQAEWAEYILFRAGIGDQLKNPTTVHSKTGWASQHSAPPPAWKDKNKTSLNQQAHEGDWIDKLMDRI